MSQLTWIWPENPINRHELRHDKINKMSVRPSRLRPAWASAQSDQESLLCTQWVAKDPKFLHADSKDSDQTGRMPRLMSLRWAHSHVVGLSCRSSLEYDLNIHSVWLESWCSLISLHCPHEKIESLAIQRAPDEDWSDWADMQTDHSCHYTCFFLNVFLCLASLNSVSSQSACG